MSLKKYKLKRNFTKTPEPAGKVLRGRHELIFVIQKHHARRLHYDFRLESGGTLKSWAVPKGPSLNPNDKRLAVEVEDHPIDYANFEGDIPKGEYGAGHVIVWDKGTWTPSGNVAAALRKGHLDFELHGEKLHGKWTLVRTRGLAGTAKSWLLMKKADEAARTTGSITEQRPESVLAKVPNNKKAKVKKIKKKLSAPPPDFIQPQLAQLVKTVPQGKAWIHEIKWDGYRQLCRIHNGKAQFITRSGLDWSSKYPKLVEAALKLPVHNAIIDGEVVWLNERGHSDFQGLQNALSEKKHARMVYYAFDLLFLNGEDLRNVPLIERKATLKKILLAKKNEKIIFSSHVEESAPQLFKEVCRNALEGLVSKDGRWGYESGRSSHWQKTKCSLRQEFVIGGYTDSPSKGRPFGALLTGVYDKNKKLRYTGKIGTGFSLNTMKDLKKKFSPLVRKTSPFLESSMEAGTHWLKPKLVAEIDFKAWTSEGIIRHGSFQGLREDKKSTSVVEEKATKSKKFEVIEEPIKITHPERMVYPRAKIRKADVIRYYREIYPLMQPFLRDRPLSLLRCPKTSGKNCFFQKHNGEQFGVRSEEVRYKEKEDTAILAETQMELVSLAQAGVLEVHGWGACFSHITQPDLMVFDLDPESVKLWPDVVETALEIRDMLEQLSLKSFAKVTGGKGLHLHVPLRPNLDWDYVKNFSKSIMHVLEKRHPNKFTTNPLKSKRHGRIFLDYLRNGYGATAVLPFSLRAKDKPSVAWPIKWSEVKPSLDPAGFLLEEVLKQVKKFKNPWSGYWDLSQTLPLVGGKKN